jgi:3-phosphoglycerate kinase
VEDDLRITTALPTLRWLFEREARVVACGHLGRPKGTPNPEFSMAPVARRLTELLGFEVPLAPGVVGRAVDNARERIEPGRLLVLENLRFERGTANDPELAARLTKNTCSSTRRSVSHRARVDRRPTAPGANGRPLARRGSGHRPPADEPGPSVHRDPRRRRERSSASSARARRCETILVGGAMAFTFLVAQG